MELVIEKLEERIAPLFVGGVVLQGGASVGAGVAASSNATNGTHGTHHSR